MSRCRNPIHDTSPSESSTIKRRHQERHFILIVGLEHVFICMVMEVTHPFDDHTPPSVDAVYVDRARSLILELTAQDLFNECEDKWVVY